MFFYPLLFVGPLSALLFFSSRFSEMEEMERKVEQIKREAPSSLERKKRKDLFLERRKEPPSFALKQKVEELSFCQKEVQALKHLLAHPAISNKRELQERLLFLSEENFISLINGETSSAAGCSETRKRQKTPVQVEEEDVYSLLSLLEEDSPGPQFLLLDFQLKRKLSSVQTECWDLTLELLKREFLQ